MSQTENQGLNAPVPAAAGVSCRVCKDKDLLQDSGGLLDTLRVNGHRDFLATSLARHLACRDSIGQVKRPSVWLFRTYPNGGVVECDAAPWRDRISADELIDSEVVIEIDARPDPFGDESAAVNIIEKPGGEPHLAASVSEQDRGTIFDPQFVGIGWVHQDTRLAFMGP